MDNREDLHHLVERFRRRDRQALSRLLTLAARGEALPTIRTLLTEKQAAGTAMPPSPDGGKALGETGVVAVTGSPGVGKSTLVGRLIEALREQGRSVAVLACDPQSPLTGGALLGDRFRMPSRPDDAQVFIRSLATPGGLGAIPEHIGLMIRLLQTFGFEWVILETVGAGQGETAVRHVADVIVLLVQPEAGDDIQWEKAGLFEVADVIVVHKADLPGAEKVEAQIRGLVNLPGAREVPVLRVSSHKQEGIAELVRIVKELSHRVRRTTAAWPRLREFVLGRVQEVLDRIGQLPGSEDLARQWQAGSLSDDQAVQAVLAHMERSLPPS